MANVRPRNTPSGRVYTFDGVDYPSVTTVLNLAGGRGLIGWAVNQCIDYVEMELKSAKPYEIPHILEDLIVQARKRHNVVRDTAGGQGTDIHKVIESRLKGKEIPGLQLVDPDGKPTLAARVLDNFDAWRDKRVFNPLIVKDDIGRNIETIEMQVRSDTHRYAGTADLIGTVDVEGELNKDEIILADLKTGKSVHKTMKLQMAAYSCAFAEMYGIQPDKCMILHVLPSAHIKEKLVMDKEEYTELFQVFLDLLSFYNWYVK